MDWTFDTNRFGDRFIQQVNGQAFDTIGSSAVFHFYYGDDLFRPFSLYCIIGTDSGLLPRYIADKGVPRGSRYIFVELPQLFDVLSQDKELFRTLPDTIYVVTADRTKETLERISFKNYVYTQKVTLYNSIGAEDDHVRQYRTLHQETQTALDAASLKISAVYGHSQLFIRAQLKNLAECLVSSDVLRHGFTDQTAVIVAGGPSLDMALPWIKKNRSRLVVLAVSRICQGLHDAGVFPDMIFSVDPEEHNYDRSKGIYLFNDLSLFLFFNHAIPKLVGQWSGRSAFIGERVPWDSKLNVATLAHEGPTVAHTAITAAMDMGFSRILLAGVDLCDNPEGISHAAGTEEHAIRVHARPKALQVTTYGGRQAETDPAMACGIDILELLGRTARENDIFLCNLSENAARVSGIPFVAPDEIMLQDLPEPASDTIDRLVPDPSSRERLHYFRQAHLCLQEAVAGISEVRRLAEEATQRIPANAAKGANGQQGFGRRTEQLDRRLSSSSLHPFTQAVKKYGVMDFLQLAQVETQDTSDAEEIRRATLHYYASLRENAQLLLSDLEEALERLDARIAEEHTPSATGIFFDQWKKDGQEARLFSWEKRHRDIVSAFSAAKKDEVDRFRCLAEEALHAGPDRSDTLRAVLRFDVIFGRIVRAFQNKNISELRSLKEALHSHPDQHQATPCLLLCRGYAAELQHDEETALAAYQEIITAGVVTNVTEAALKRVASLSLSRQDTDNALLALECLSQIRPKYRPKYADLLRLAGRTNDAINVYTEHITASPTDIASLLQLGRLYEEIQVADAARMAYEMVLEQDPGNRAAQTFLSQLDNRC